MLISRKEIDDECNSVDQQIEMINIIAKLGYYQSMRSGIAIKLLISTNPIKMSTR